jgi:hypothetical protein
MKEMIGHHARRTGNLERQIQALETSLAGTAQKLQSTRDASIRDYADLISTHVAVLAATKEAAARDINAAKNAHLESLGTLEAALAAERVGHAATVRSVQESAALSFDEMEKQHVSAAKVQG